MSQKEKEFKITVECPDSDLSDKEKEVLEMELEKKLKNTKVNIFPEAPERDEVLVLARPKVRGPGG